MPRRDLGLPLRIAPRRGERTREQADHDDRDEVRPDQDREGVVALERHHVRRQHQHVLVEACKRFGMVFVGYSGRDASVMEALTSVLRETAPFPNGLHWVTTSASRLLPAVTQFLESAHLAGVDVAVVECKTFDELAADVIRGT